MVTFCSHFQKKWLTDFQTYRKILIRSALKSSDPGASNEGSNFEIRLIGADLVSFEVARLPEKRARLRRQNSKLSQNAHENWKFKAVRNGREKSRTVRSFSTGFLKGPRAKCDHKVPKRVWVRIVLRTVSENYEFSVFIRILAQLRVRTTQSSHFLWLFRHFKTHEIDFKWLDVKVWLTIRRVRVSTLKRISN